jgi:hypothetical protein
MSAFSKLQKVTKLTNSLTALDATGSNSLFRRVNNLYISNNLTHSNNHFYGTLRQHNLASVSSLNLDYSVSLDKKSFFKFFEYILDNTSTKRSLSKNPTKYVELTSLSLFKSLYTIISNTLNNNLLFLSPFTSSRIPVSSTLQTPEQGFITPILINSKKYRFFITNYSTYISDELFINLTRNFCT